MYFKANSQNMNENKEYKWYKVQVCLHGNRIVRHFKKEEFWPGACLRHLQQISTSIDSNGWVRLLSSYAWLLLNLPFACTEGETSLQNQSLCKAESSILNAPSHWYHQNFKLFRKERYLTDRLNNTNQFASDEVEAQHFPLFNNKLGLFKKLRLWHKTIKIKQEKYDIKTNGAEIMRHIYQHDLESI